jgi:catechol 2,3-dioxygenase-like lactoylglutathione lyase family enzyme
MVSTRDIIIKVDGVKAAKAFYRDVLGFRLVDDDDRMLGFETGSFMLFVEPGEPSGPVFELKVDDAAAAKAELLAKGCILVEEDPKRPRLYLRDPFGIVFNLTQRSD